MAASNRRRDVAGEAWLAMTDLVFRNERRREVSEAIGLSFGKVRVLRRIVDQPLPMGELAADLGIEPPNLTTLIDGLERAGLVERKAHPTDRRVLLVVDTAAGVELARRAADILNCPPAGFGELSCADLESLAEILARIPRD